MAAMCEKINTYIYIYDDIYYIYMYLNLYVQLRVWRE